ERSSPKTKVLNAPPLSSFEPVPMEKPPVMLMRYAAGNSAELGRTAPMSSSFTGSLGVCLKVNRLSPALTSLTIDDEITRVHPSFRKRLEFGLSKANGKLDAVPSGRRLLKSAKNHRALILSLAESSLS